MSETESISAIDQWDRLGDDKTQLLEELTLLQADNIGKLDVKEVMLRYFENRQRLGCAPWDNDNQALRQLFSASCRVPRVRHFPGSAGRVVGQPALPPATSTGGARRRIAATHQPLTVLTGSSSSTGQAQQQRQQQRTQKLAEHLINAEDTYEGIERELAALSERLVAQSLSQAVYNSAVHQLAVRLVRRALDRASEHLSSSSREASSVSAASGAAAANRDAARIDAIAQELARSQERGDPRELTFASERAESVAEGLLDQVMADAAEVVGRQD